MEIRLIFLLIACFLGSFKADNGVIQHDTCDNGRTNIDIEPGAGVCQDQVILSLDYNRPAGESHCQEEREIKQGRPLCVNESISYHTSLPLSGDYRPRPPQYGEYDYLPPQRWLHALKYGAVAFLYHPCAPLGELIKLKRLARSCLWRHVITPSDHLPQDQPFALVSWGCVYSMSWVDREQVVQWLQLHGHGPPESPIAADELYNHGLIEPSYIVSTTNDSVICPSDTTSNEPPSVHSNTSSSNVPIPSNSTTDNRITNTNTPSVSSCSETDDYFVCGHHNYITVVLHHYPLLYVVIVLMGVVICTLTLFVVLLCCGKKPCCFTRKKTLGRYKPCGQFYTSKGNQSTVGIAIPELGVPKVFSSEREKLLNDSDEDDL